MTRSLFSPLTASYLGFDSFFNEIDRMLELASSQAVHGGYPPLNVFKNGENYTIEIAVAGFKEADIKIEHDERHGTLHITGDTGTKPLNDGNVPVKLGIATRKFSRSFTIADNLKVESATLEDGMLTIKLAADEEKTYIPRQIPLSTPQAALPAPSAETAEDDVTVVVVRRLPEEGAA